MAAEQIGPQIDTQTKRTPLVMFDAGLGSNIAGIDNGIGRFLRDKVGPENVIIYTSDTNQIFRFHNMKKTARQAIKEGRDVVFIGSSAGVVEAATFAQGMLRSRTKRERNLPHLKVVTMAPVTAGAIETFKRLYQNSILVQHRSYSLPATWLKGIDIYEMFTTPDDPSREQLSKALERARPEPIDYTRLPVKLDSGELEEAYNHFDDLPDDKKIALRALRREVNFAIERGDLEVIRDLTIAQCYIVEPYLEKAWRGEYTVPDSNSSVEHSISASKKGLEKIFSVVNLVRGTVNGITHKYIRTLQKLSEEGLRVDPVAFRHDMLAPVTEAVTFIPGKEVQVFEGSHATHYVRPPKNFDQLFS